MLRPVLNCPADFKNFNDLITIADKELLWQGETSKKVLPLSLVGWKNQLSGFVVLLISIGLIITTFSFIEFSIGILLIVLLAIIFSVFSVLLSPYKIEYGITKEAVYIKTFYLYRLRTYHVNIKDIVKPSLLIFDNNPFGTIILMTKLNTGVKFRDVVNDKPDMYPSIQYIESYNEVYDILLDLKKLSPKD